MEDMVGVKYYCYENTVLLRENNGILEYYQPDSCEWIISLEWAMVFSAQRESFTEIEEEYVPYYIAGAIKYYKRKSGTYVRKMYGTKIQYFNTETKEWEEAPLEWLWDDYKPLSKEDLEIINNLNSKKMTR